MSLKFVQLCASQALGLRWARLFNDDGKLAAAGRDARVVQPLQGRKGAEVGVVHEEVEAGLASKSSYIPVVGTQYA